MRIFIAIELEDATKKQVLEAESRIRERLHGIKWVKYENLHITLRFLGEVSEEKVKKVERAIEKVSSDTSSFVISGGSFGAFPAPDRARVLFFGIEEGKVDVYKVFEKLERELAKMGFEREKKPYHPHITIGRGKRRFFDVSEFLELKAPFKQKVSGLTLFKSTLTPQGPIYTVIMRGEFK